MAKKFFYDKVHNTKKTITHLIIIGVCVIGIIICFILTSHFQAERKKNNGELSIKSEVTIEVNEEYNKEIFFSKIENTNLDNVEIKYPDNFDKSLPGEYTITITINKKDYETKLIVIDTTKPELILKDLVIKEKEKYSANDFVVSCVDNSGKACIIDFYQDAIDEDGNKIVYTNYESMGAYSIKIAASDEAGNQNIIETNLIIEKEKDTTEPGGNTDPEPENPDKDPVEVPVCKYGDNSYDKDEYILALDVTTGGCAISLDLYYDNKEIEKIMDNEQTRLIKDAQKLNLTGIPHLERKLVAITNYSGKGIIGYELRMIYKIKNGDDFDIIADYKLNTAGRRIFTINKYNLND